MLLFYKRHNGRMHAHSGGVISVSILNNRFSFQFNRLNSVDRYIQGTAKMKNPFFI